MDGGAYILLKTPLLNFIICSNGILHTVIENFETLKHCILHDISRHWSYVFKHICHMLVLRQNDCMYYLLLHPGEPSF